MALTIPPPPGACTVVVTVDLASDAARQAVLAHARLGLRRFGEFEGFLGGALHVSADGRRIVQYLQWASEDLYVACRDAPLWDELPTTAPFFAHVQDGSAKVNAAVVDVVDVAPADPHAKA